MPAGRRPPADRAMREPVQLHLLGGLNPGVSLDEVVHRASAMSRRTFLRFSAVAAGLANAIRQQRRFEPVYPWT